MKSLDSTEWYFLIFGAVILLFIAFLATHDMSAADIYKSKCEAQGGYYFSSRSQRLCLDKQTVIEIKDYK